MTPRVRRLLLHGLQLGIVVLVCWGIYRALRPELARISWADVKAVRPNIMLLLLSTLLLVGVYAAHAELWRGIVTQLIGTRPPLRPAMNAYFLSSLGRYVPGKLWQVAGLAALAAQAGFSAVAAVAASLLAQLAFLSTGLIMVAVLLPELFGEQAVLAITLAVAAVAVVFVFAGTQVGTGLRHRMAPRLGTRVAAAFRMFDRVRPGRALVWWFAYAITWLLLGAAFIVFVTAFAPTALAHSARLAGAIAASYLAGYLSLMPGGVGVREITMTGLLIPAVTPAQAIVIAVLSRVWFTVAELLPLGIVAVLPRPRYEDQYGDRTHYFGQDSP